MTSYRWTSGIHILLVWTLMMMTGQTRGMDRAGALPARLLVGYWHNFDNGSGVFRLRDVPDAYDVVNVAFAVPTVPFGSTLHFEPDPSIYANADEFRSDIALLKSRNKVVLISVGGATAPVRLDDSASVNSFAGSLRDIIDINGFDGVDIDLEGSSLELSLGDSDFRAPVTPRIVNLIRAIRLLTDQRDSNFVLSMAPETAYVQGGYGKYSGVYGAYLPVIHALRDRITYLHVQHYNTGSMYGRDGIIYYPPTADFHVAMADALLAGFNVVSGVERTIYFDALPADKILIGLPASPLAAGSGFTPASDVHAALDYLISGKSFGGRYLLARPGGYRAFRGLMTWSINWDVYAGSSFANAHRTYLDNLPGVTSVSIPDDPAAAGTVLYSNYPNPFNPTTTIRFTIARRSHVRLSIANVLGQTVGTLVDDERDAGTYSEIFDASDLAGGVYFYRLRTAGAEQGGRMILVK